MTNRFQFRIWDEKFGRFLDKNDSSLHCFSDWQINPFTGEVSDFIGAISGAPDSRSKHSCFKNEFIIQQYTGLKDSKRRKIYEGDIVEYKSGNDKYNDLVFWSNGAFMVGATIRNPIYYLNAVNSHAKVIGNIFENKNLLK